MLLDIHRPHIGLVTARYHWVSSIFTSGGPRRLIDRAKATRCGPKDSDIFHARALCDLPHVFGVSPPILL
jgi:hypothetical protein